VNLRELSEQTHMAPITVRWTDARQIAIYVELQAGWGWNALYTTQTEVNQMMAQQPHVVDLIYDMSTTQILPRGYFSHLKRINDAYPENCGMVLMVGCNRVVMQMLRGLTTSYWYMAQRFAFCDTVDEAYELVGP
jgi:hypothetical protein